MITSQRTDGTDRTDGMEWSGTNELKGTERTKTNQYKYSTYACIYHHNNKQQATSTVSIHH